LNLQQFRVEAVSLCGVGIKRNGALILLFRTSPIPIMQNQYVAQGDVRLAQVIRQF